MALAQTWLSFGVTLSVLLLIWSMLKSPAMSKWGTPVLMVCESKEHDYVIKIAITTFSRAIHTWHQTINIP